MAHASTSIKSPGDMSNISHNLDFSKTFRAALCPGASLMSLNTKGISPSLFEVSIIPCKTLVDSRTLWTPFSMSRKAILGGGVNTCLNVSDITPL